MFCLCLVFCSHRYLAEYIKLVCHIKKHDVPINQVYQFFFTILFMLSMFGLGLNIKCQCNYECLFLEILFNQIRHVSWIFSIEHTEYKIFSCMTGYEKYTIISYLYRVFFRVIAERRHSVTFSIHVRKSFLSGFKTFLI